jgi:hypothetical protein
VDLEPWGDGEIGWIKLSTNTQINHYTITTNHFAGVGARHTYYKWGNDAEAKRKVALRGRDLEAIFWRLDFLLLRFTSTKTPCSAFLTQRNKEALSASSSFHVLKSQQV